MVTCVELKPKLETAQVDGIFQLPGKAASTRSIFVMNTHFDDRGGYGQSSHFFFITFTESFEGPIHLLILNPLYR